MSPVLDKIEGPYELLEKVVETLSEKVAKLEEVNAGGAIVSTESKPNYAQIPSETFEFKKKTYRFLVSGIHHEGQKITATEALKDEELLELFVETYPRTVEKINL